MPLPRATVNKVKEYVGASAGLFLGGVFLLASTTKSADLDGLAAATKQFELFPSSVLSILAIAVERGWISRTVRSSFGALSAWRTDGLAWPRQP